MTTPGILIAALLLLAGVLLSKTSSRFGLPSLLLFLFLGMIAGSDGLGIEFDDAGLARQIGIIALAFILFGGGLSTHWPDVRRVLVPGVALATVGVLVTASVLGVLAAMILDIDPLQGLLLGTIIAATDAAAVFSILRSRGLGLGERLGSLLELESGSNDPTAVFLTVATLALVQNDDAGVVILLASFAWQMAAGLVVGWLLARCEIVLINRLRLEYDGLYPVLTVAFVLITFEVTTAVGASGFLATYVAGLTLSHASFLHKGSLQRFHDGVSWLLQIGMFVVFGLLVFPSDLVPVAGPALLIAALLIFVARPLAVVLVLVPLRVPANELAFVSWVGLRGATPIILATFPLVAGVAGAETIFNVVFFVVLTSVLLQGTTIPKVARLLGVSDEDQPRSNRAFEAIVSGDTKQHLREVRIPPGSLAAGRTMVELDLPEGVLVLLLHRQDAVYIPQGKTLIEVGDDLLVLAQTDDDHADARDILCRSGAQESSADEK